MDEGNKIPLRISINTKRGIVRVNRNVFKVLGDPEFIRLLIDRDSHIVAVQVSAPDDRDRIPSPDYSKTFRFQINSKALTESLANIVGWKQDSTYQVHGTLSEDLILFDLSKAIEKLKPE